MKIVAILSTTVLPIDGTYTVETINMETIEGIITGVPHYIGHPTTKAIVEAFGAIPAETNLFKGLQPGETAICFEIKQGLSSRSVENKTVDQDITLGMLCIRRITMLSEQVRYNCATSKDKEVRYITCGDK